MNEKNIQDFIKIFDKRYVQKEDINKHIFDIADNKYAKKEDLIQALGKIEAIQLEQAKSHETLDKIYDLVTQIKETQSIQGAKLSIFTEDLEQAKKNIAHQVWVSLPKVIRMSLVCFSVLVMLFIFTIMIGDPMTIFMEKNGLIVAISTAIISYIFARKEK